MPRSARRSLKNRPDSREPIRRIRTPVLRHHASPERVGDGESHRGHILGGRVDKHHGCPAPRAPRPLVANAAPQVDDLLTVAIDTKPPRRRATFSANAAHRTADTALHQGHAIACDIGALLLVCHVLPEAFMVRMLFPQDAGIDPAVQGAIEEKARQAIRGRLDALISGDRSIPIELETGTPHAGILTISDRTNAGLIVVGPGKTAERVTRAAAVPVLIARPWPHEGGILAATDFSERPHPRSDSTRGLSGNTRPEHALGLPPGPGPRLGLSPASSSWLRQPWARRVAAPAPIRRGTCGSCAR